MRLIKGIIITAIAIFISSQLLDRVNVVDFKAAIFAAIVLGILNFTVIPILKLVTWPLNLVTFGLMSLILNGLAIKMTADLVRGFSIYGRGTGVIAAILISIIQSFLTKLFNDDKNEIKDSNNKGWH